MKDEFSESPQRINLSMLEEPIGITYKGQVLDIFGIAPCLGLAAYDPLKERVYGGHIKKADIDEFFGVIPEESIPFLKLVTFGYIPIPTNAFKKGCVPNNYEELFVNQFFSKLEKDIEHMQDRYGILLEQFVFRDSLHCPQFRNFDSMGISAFPEKGSADLFAKITREGEYNLIETIDFLA